MPSLADYQQAMHAYLLADEEAPQLLAPWCAGEPASCASRLATYRDTCSGTLVNALRLTYPAVRQVLGAQFFDAQAAQFARREPPEGAYLNAYGEHFAPFVAALPTTASLSYLADLARLEWAVSRALHAPNTPALDPARLQALAPQDLAQVRFRAHPAVSALALRVPAERIWQAVLARDEAGMRAIDLSAGAGWVLVDRDTAHTVQITRIPDAIGRLSEQLFAGAPLHAVLGVAHVQQRAQHAGDLQAALADHLACGRLVDFDLETPPTQGCSAHEELAL
jgi:hypothetical protein